MLNRKQKMEWFILFMILAAVTLYVVFFLVPGIQSFQVSTMNWSGFNRANIKHVGLDNFSELVHDEVFRKALVNNIFFIVVGGVFSLTLSLLFGVMFTGKYFFGRSFFRSIIFFPYTVSVVAIGLMWIFILSPNLGLLNEVLRRIGMEKLAIAWLGHRWSAMGSMTFISVWWVLGFYMTLLIAGINRIPLTFYESAVIDGASSFKQFRFITVPLLREVLLIIVMYWLMAGWKAFGVFYVMTQGGPNNMTHTLATYMIWTSLNYTNGAYRMGYGTAIAVVLFLLVALVALLYKFFTRKEAIQY